jgi:hypothetical protein
MTARDPSDNPGDPSDNRSDPSDEILDPVDASEIRGEAEEPPAGDDFFSGMFTEPQPFAQPPGQPVTVVGEVPWELRDDDDPAATETEPTGTQEQ